MTALRAALTPFEAAAKTVEFYVEDAFSFPRYPLEGTKLDPDGPPAQALEPSHFLNLLRVLKEISNA